MAASPVLEHRTGRLAPWLREHRLRLALILAAVETALVLTEVVGWFSIILIAAAVFAFHVFVGRRARFAWLRQMSWIATLAQVLPAVVPVVVGLAIVALSTLLVLALIAAAIAVVLWLFFSRR